MQNENLLQSFVGNSAQANNITHIHLAKNRHMINGIRVDALKSINTTTYCNILLINSLNYAGNFLLTPVEIYNR